MTVFKWIYVFSIMSSKLDRRLNAVLGLIPGEGAHTGVLALSLRQDKSVRKSTLPSFFQFQYDL